MSYTTYMLGGQLIYGQWSIPEPGGREKEPITDHSSGRGGGGGGLGQ